MDNSYNEEKTEKRKHPRIKAHFMISYRIVGEDDFIMTSIRSISEGGIAFTVDAAVGLNARLEMRVNIPSSLKSIDIGAEVVGCENILDTNMFLVRVKFLELPMKARNLIQQLVTLYRKADEASRGKSFREEAEKIKHMVLSMTFSHERLIKILVEKGVVSEHELDHF
ncbi:MAG: PilZ domain-containing protein [Candidatus Omnitrophota bacterium]